MYVGRIQGLEVLRPSRSAGVGIAWLSVELPIQMAGHQVPTAQVYELWLPLKAEGHPIGRAAWSETAAASPGTQGGYIALEDDLVGDVIGVGHGNGGE
jgi:hypothetical protein